MKHVNPYHIHDPDDLFEVTENSSHPELGDAERIWTFGAYTFRTASKAKDFFLSEGLDPKRYWYDIRVTRQHTGKHRIFIDIVPKHQAISRRKLYGSPA